MLNDTPAPKTKLAIGCQTNCIGGGGEGRERHVLFNDVLNTFYLWLNGVKYMVKKRFR